MVQFFMRWKNFSLALCQQRALSALSHDKFTFCVCVCVCAVAAAACVFITNYIYKQNGLMVSAAAVAAAVEQI
jgi:hypothetical protein